MKKILAAVLSLFLATPVFAQVTSVGVGTVFATPDCAHLNFVISTEAKTASVAHTTNRTNSDAFFALLKKNDVAAKDISTDNFSISPRWFTAKDEEPKVVGYIVNHQLTVKVRDLKTVGTLIDGLVNDQVRLQHISFAVTDRAKYEDQARDLALANAKKKAQQLVGGLDSTLGKLVSVSESAEFSRTPYMQTARMADSSPTQIAAGEQAITVRVNAVWEAQPAFQPLQPLQAVPRSK